VQVLSDTEYLADIKVKISFVAASFKIKTTILETRPPHYLRCEGTGEDSSVASSLKQTSEIFLTEQPGGQTEIRVKAKADVFGRLGSFGLTVMKTKADRMWEEFAANLAAVLRQGLHAGAGDVPEHSPHGQAVQSLAGTPSASPSGAPEPAHSKWWQRVVGALPTASSDTARALRLPSDIYVEVRRGDAVIKVLWPASAQADVAAWLRNLTDSED
jgi:carbon monoxide dehydrogenase subunit G